MASERDEGTVDVSQEARAAGIMLGVRIDTACLSKATRPGYEKSDLRDLLQALALAARGKPPTPGVAVRVGVRRRGTRPDQWYTASVREVEIPAASPEEQARDFFAPRRARRVAEIVVKCERE